jgi:hypothetical protein
MPVPLQTSTITDRLVRTKPATPTLGAEGYQLLDPAFQSWMARVTDGNTISPGRNQSFNVNASGSQHGWSSDSKKWYVEDTTGNFYVAAFDKVTLTWTWSAAIGLYNDLSFDQQGTHPNLLYGSLTSAPNHHTVGTADVTNLGAPVYATLFDAATIVGGSFPGGDTYLNTIQCQKDKLIVLCGGGSQDHHYFVIWYVLSNPGATLVLNTLTRTEFKNQSGVVGLHIHSASADLSGRWVVLTPAAGDNPQYKAYIWDTALNSVTPVTISPGGHMESGANGELVNQDTFSGPYDSFQYVGRTLVAPDANLYNVINPTLTPYEAYLADHASPNDAVAGQPFVFTSSTYRYNDANGAPYSYISSPRNLAPWRAYDGEVVRVNSVAGQTTTAIRRLCHNRALADSQTQNASGFPNQPLLNVSPDGRWCLFQTNWDGTLGTDSVDGFWRRDVFLLYMGEPPPPLPSLPPIVFTFVSRASAAPTALLSPNRYQQTGTQAHQAGNLLVVVIAKGQAGAPAVANITNLAGDTFLPTLKTPYLDFTTTHQHEIWYCIKTNGHPADQLTVYLVGNGSAASLTLSIYEFATVDPTMQAQYTGLDVAAAVGTDPNNFIVSPVLPITAPSVIIAGYRNSNSTVPTSPSGVQGAAPSTDGSTTVLFDSYQFASSPQNVHATIPQPPIYAQWSILATAFTVTASPPLPPPPPPPLLTPPPPPPVSPVAPLNRTWGYAYRRPATPNTTNAPLGMAPGATVAVLAAGTPYLVLLYADAGAVTPLANPFVADIDGYYEFYAANGVRIDIQFSGVGVPTPYTLPDAKPLDLGTEF